MSENNDNSSESNSVGSETFYQASRLNRGVNSILRQSVLRPSVLDTAVNVSTSANLDAPKDAPAETAKNPFTKEFNDKEELKDTEALVDGKAEAADKVITSSADEGAEAKTADTKDDKKIHAEDEEHDERPDPMIMLRKNGLERCNLFATSKNSIPRVETSGFVFGENVHERVVGENVHADGNAKHEINMNGTSGKTSDMLFSSVIQNAAKSASENNTGTSDGGAACMAVVKENEAKSLNDVAREYEESRGAQKRKYEEVETFTGEEDEQNIVDINCKLFAFINSNWEERGRGSLRLNAGKNECSRVVFRTSGNLRLVLNTKVWAGMLAERPSQKSLRLTALDATGKIKIFLVMGRPADITLLHSALVERISMRKRTHPFECQEDGNEAVADSQTDTGFDEDDDEKHNNNEAVVVSSSVGLVHDDSGSEISTNDSEAIAVKSVTSTSTQVGQGNGKIDIDEDDDDDGEDNEEENTEKALAEPSSKKKLVDPQANN